MADFNFLRQYVVPDTSSSPNANTRHIFYPVQTSDIIKAEEKLGFILPDELEEFYKAIGYGTFHVGNDNFAFYRFLAPSAVASIHLREQYYGDDPDLDLYDDPNRLIFFEVNEGLYLTIDLTVKGERSPVYYITSKIADSIEEFARQFSQDVNYFDQFDEE